MGYDNRNHMVRVDFFKPSGKWYDTEAVDMHSAYNQKNIHTAVLSCIETHLMGRYRGFTAVVLEPYSEIAHPLMLKIPESFQLGEPNPQSAMTNDLDDVKLANELFNLLGKALGHDAFLDFTDPPGSSGSWQAFAQSVRLLFNNKNEAPQNPLDT